MPAKGEVTHLCDKVSDKSSTKTGRERAFLTFLVKRGRFLRAEHGNLKMHAENLEAAP